MRFTVEKETEDHKGRRHGISFLQTLENGKDGDIYLKTDQARYREIRQVSDAL
jgi:hypothetical protein